MWQLFPQCMLGQPWMGLNWVCWSDRMKEKLWTMQMSLRTDWSSALYRKTCEQTCREWTPSSVTHGLTFPNLCSRCRTVDAIRLPPPPVSWRNSSPPLLNLLPLTAAAPLSPALPRSPPLPSFFFFSLSVPVFMLWPEGWKWGRGSVAPALGHVF